MLKKIIPELKSLKERMISADEITRPFTKMYDIKGMFAIPLKCLDYHHATFYMSIQRDVNLKPTIVCGLDNLYLGKKALVKTYDMSKIEAGRFAKEILSHLKHIRLVKTFISNENPSLNRSTEKIIAIKDLNPYLVYDSYYRIIRIQLEFNEADIPIIDELMSFLEPSDAEYSIYDRAIVNLYIKGDFLMKYVKYEIS